MIMPRSDDQLLLPVSPVFMATTVLAALALNIIPLGRAAAMPDWVAVVLVCWNVHQPRRVGVYYGFALGLVMDVHHGAILGQHALAYTVLSTYAVGLHRRLLWFGVTEQALQILPVFALAHFTSFAVRMLAGGMLPSAWALSAPVWEALLWPVVSFVLLAPQRRAPDPDKHRPL